MKLQIGCLSMLLCLVAAECGGAGMGVKAGAAGASPATLSADEARSIAVGSECVEKGKIGASEGFNEHSGTWWFTLDMKPEFAKDGCSPACVVTEETRSAEINWRCTGLKL